MTDAQSIAVEAVARALAAQSGADWDATSFLQTPAGESPVDMREGFYDLARVAIAAMPAASESKPIAWMYHVPGDLEHGWQRLQTYEGMSCIEEDAGTIETPLYAHPAPSDQEKHRNDLYDKVMAQLTEIGALKSRLAGQEKLVGELVEALERIGNWADIGPNARALITRARTQAKGAAS